METFVQNVRAWCAGMAIALSLVLWTLSAHAQTGGIRGKVTDERQHPLSGASVSIKELSRSAGTDEDGGYAFEGIPAGRYTVTVSYLGYAAVERRVVVAAGAETLDVRFQSAGMRDLDEVVVIGYGTVRKRDLTGSVASVSEKDFNKGIVAAPDQLIQGKAAGVMVMNNSGQPGGSTTIRVRGNSSLRSGNNPLFVVDGIPLSGSAARPSFTGNRNDFGADGGNPLSYLNPNDIASIDVLKDASATAIYGSRGANGVILISTKRGQTGAPMLGVQASTGASSILRKIEVLSGDEFRDALDFYGLNKSLDFGSSEHAFDAITRTAVTQNHSVDVSGGTDAGRYRVSTGYFDQQGIIGKSNMEKLTASLNGSFSFMEDKRLALDIGILATQTSENIAAAGSNTDVRSVIRNAMIWNPTRPLRQADGNLTYVDRETINPLGVLEAYRDDARVNTIIANLSPSYRITDYLVYKFAYGLTQQSGKRTGRFIKGIIEAGEPNNGEAFAGNSTESNHQLAHTLAFDKEVAAGLNINAMAGYEYLSYDSRNFTASGNGFRPMGDIEYYDFLQYADQDTRGVSSYRSPANELQSYFARAVLNWRDRYLFTGTIRRDGSTKFGANNKYATFPSLALAWNLHNEAFLKDNSLVSSLKLRGGWGETGNSEFPSGRSRDVYTFGMQRMVQSQLGNPSLKWESSATLNVGADFGLFQDRLSGSVEYFDKRTTDALFARTVAQPAPGASVWENIDGEIRNHGVEVALNGAIVQKEDWDWSLGLNATYLENMVSKLADPFHETAGGRQRIENGRPLNIWYMSKFEGIDPATGMSLYRALDGTTVGTKADGIEPSQNKHYLGTPSPKYLLGLSTSARWKRLTATLNANGAFGHWIMNGNTRYLIPGSMPRFNMAKALFDKSLKENTLNADEGSDRFLEKGDYLKLANLTLSYSIGTLANRLKNLNVSLTGQNLLVLTGYTGFDPEIANSISGGGIPQMGIEAIPYPPVRTFLLGVNFAL